MTLADMADHVVERIGSPDVESVKQAKRFLKYRYQMLYGTHLWQDSKVTLDLETSSNEVILPNWVDKVLQVIVDNRRLSSFDRQNIAEVDPRLLEETGELIGFSMLSTVGTHTHPVGVKVTLESTETTDNSNARLRGLYSGLEVEETVVLSGTTPVTSTNYFDEITSLSKAATTGAVKAKRVSDSAEELVVLLPSENDRRHSRIQIHRNFTGTKTLTVMAKRKVIPLIHDYDTPTLDCSGALVAFATADMLDRMRQAGKAQAKVMEAQALVASMVDRDRNQQAHVVRFIPED